jgi:hypothetical protein
VVLGCGTLGFGFWLVGCWVLCFLSLELRVFE